MVDKNILFDDFITMQVGETMAYPVASVDEIQPTKQAIDAAAREYAKTFGVAFGTSYEGLSVHVQLIEILRGSPLKARVPKPWHGMGVGQRVRLDGKEWPKTREPALRVYISNYSAKLGQSMWVQQVKDGYLVHRTK